MATKTEIERLSVVETKVDAIGADVKDIKDTLVSEIKEINVKFDNLDNKYAAKWVQSAVAFVVGIIVSAVLVALVALVVIKPGDTPSTSTTNNTTTTTTPTGSTSTSKGTTTPSASATSNASATPSNPQATDTQTSGGGVQVTLPKP